MIRRKRLLVVLAAALAFPAGALPSSSASLTFPRGVWVGKGTVAARALTSGATKIHMSAGTASFLLVVFKDKKAHGSLDLHIPHGSAEVAGSSGEVKVVGDFDLAGKSNAIHVTGSYHLSGAVIAAGVEVPIDLTVPIEPFPFDVQTATCAKVTGRIGPYVHWTATRKPGTTKACT